MPSVSSLIPLSLIALALTLALFLWLRLQEHRVKDIQDTLEIVGGALKGGELLRDRDISLQLHG